VKNTREFKLAEKIIQLDLLRDELYEELLKTYGWKAQDFLRAVQNSQCADHSPKKLQTIGAQH
jgi:hypothetical protein